MDKKKIEEMVLAVYPWLKEVPIEERKQLSENAVVLTEEEYKKLIYWEGRFDEIVKLTYETTRKETAEKFARLVEFHSVSTRDNDGREIFTISALGLKEILHEEFGIPYDEICKKITEVSNEN